MWLLIRRRDCCGERADIPFSDSGVSRYQPNFPFHFHGIVGLFNLMISTTVWTLDSGNRMKRELITNTVAKTNNLLANKHSILKSDGRSQNNAVTQLNLDKADRIVPRAQLPRGCLSRSSRPCFSMVDFIIIPKRRCLFRTSSERPSFLVNSAQADRNLDHVFTVVR